MSKDCWVSPSGKVTWCAFGCHLETAYKIVDAKDWSDDLMEWELKNGYRYVTDYLHDVRKYIRYQDWKSHKGWSMNDTPPPKKQQQRMFEINNEKD